ncbi:MAG: class D sortase [Halioglobus sp.]
MVFRAGELLSYSAGILLTGFFVSQLAQSEVQRQGDIAQFEQAMSVSAQPLLASLDTDPSPGSSSAPPTATESLSPQQAGAPDTSLWAPGRIADYEASMQADIPQVLGLLEVPSVGLKVPIYPSDSELNMDRGAGIIDGMAYPHEPGNIGIAGHRDGYFRVLKDVEVGEKILLQTLEGPKQFTINSTRVVEISDRSVLQDTEDQTVTLITCYPFYFVGHAPQRYIVTASLDITDVNQQ